MYTTFTDGEQLAVMKADGSERRALPGVAYEAAWSPEDEQFAYVTSHGMNNEEIYVMNTDGSERTRLTDIPGYDHWPQRGLRTAPASPSPPMAPKTTARSTL